MSALFTFEQLKKDLANTYIPLVCMIVITLLTISCNTVPTKQTDTAVNSLTTKEKSDNETTANKKQELECRDVEITGSRFKRKVCEYKETWAAIDKKNERQTDELVRNITEQSGIINAEGAVSSDVGKVNSAITPPGGF